MDEDLHTLIQNCSIFSSLPRRTFSKYLPRFEKIELHQDEILYHQGDPSDSIEILLEGKLAAILTSATGENRVIGYISAGETVGEIGALSGEPRSVTVKALTNSTLFRLPTELFIEICSQYPGVMFAAIHPIVRRSHQIIQTLSPEKSKKHIAIIPANKEVSVERFAELFADSTNALSSIVLLSDYQPEFKTQENIQSFINEAKIKNTKKIRQKFIYLLKPEETVLNKFCFDKVDMIYVLADDIAPPYLDDYVLKKLTEHKNDLLAKHELIIAHKSDIKMPTKSLNWIGLEDFNMHHQLRLNHRSDFRRLLRYMRGKAVGVVLGGGGTRGWAHLGALRAILEAGIPIDAIGGTSVGSIIAASYAMTGSYDETLTQFRELMDQSRNTITWRNLTWPAISLYNAKGLTQVLQKIFDDYLIENLWLPYFCISTNLAKNIDAVHTRGILWERVRSSISIPGLIPPVLIDGELHFDGGLLNNLPTDVMRKMIGYKGTIIGVELGGTIKDKHHYQFPPILTFWQALFAKLGIYKGYRFPHFIDTFLKSMLVGSSWRAQQNALIANIMVSIDLSRYDMYHSNKRQEERIIELGYETMINEIKNMKRDN